MTQHGYISHPGEPDFATAMSVGGGGSEFVGDDTSGPLGIGTSNGFSAMETFLSFDTSAVTSPPATATLTLGQTFGSPPDPTADVIVAAYNWGATIETADWRTSAQLAALTEVGRIAAASLPGAGSTFDIDIDPSAIVLSGTTRFVVFTENMKTPTTDPTGNQQFFIDGAADTNPPALNTVAPPPVGPTVTHVTPTFGPIAGGTAVTITGTGFATATGVQFGGVSAASFGIVDANTITAVAPAHADGIAHITVVNDVGTSPESSVDAFSFYDLDTPPPPADPVTIRVVTVNGTVATNLPLAWCDTITRTHNQPREAVVKFAKQSYTRDQVHIFAKDDGTGDLHEIQVIRNGIVRFWGPAVLADTQSGQGEVTLHCRDPLWYLMRRFLDAQRTNLLTNPSFETGNDSGWTSVGALTTDEVTTFDAVRGIYSLHLASSTPLGDIFKKQTVTVTGTGVGTLVTIVAYFHIASITGHSVDRRGLYVEARESGTFKTNNYYPIDEATPTGDWIRATTTIQVPPNTTWDLEVRLYSPPGSIRWDDGQVVAMQSISTASLTGNLHTPVDIAAIVELIVNFVQNPSVGKSDLNIGLDNPTVGTKMVKHIQWADHIGFWDQMSEWLPRLDVALRNTDATHRDLVIYPPHQGTDRRGDFTIFFSSRPEDAAAKNVVSYTFTEDGGGVITDDTEIEQDTGSGPDREEGHYADPSLIGGLVLQAVNSAPPKAEPASLNPIAIDAVNKARRPSQLFTFTLKGDEIAPGTGQPWDELLGLGDICDFAVTDGWPTVSGFGRISQIVEHLDNRLLEVTIPLAV